jgi:iron complex outermembrane receptor protein
MKTNPKFRRAATLLLAASAVPALAQQGDAENTAALDEIVVTATRTAQPIQNIPAAVTVINRERIEQSNATTVDQLLAEVPGVYAARMDVAAPNRIAQTYTRGMSGNGRTLVLIDGVPMNVQYDGQVDWSQLTTRDVERVEVVRGAGSGLYGGNAMGGVINILTRSPKPGLEKNIAVEYGSNETGTLAASLRGRSGATGFALSASQLKSDGYDMWTEAQKAAAGSARDKLIAIGTEKKNFSGKLEHEISVRDQVDFNVSYLDDEATGFYDIPGYLPQRREQWLTSGRYRHFGDAAETTVVLYGRFGKQYADSTARPYTAIAYQGTYDDRTVGINAQSIFRPSETQQLTVGADYLDGSIDVTEDRYAATPGRESQRKGYVTRLGVFAQDELKLGTSWIAHVVGRFDHWKTHGSQADTLAGQPTGDYAERSGTEFSPKLSVLYKLLPQTNLRASVGKAFKLPELWEMYSSSRRGTVTYWGNPDLEPETVIAHEIGLDHYFGTRGYAKFTLYRNDADSFVYSVQRDATNNDKTNVEGVVTKGLEIEAAYRPFDKLRLSAAYTYNNSTVTESASDPALVGKQLIYVPRHQGYARADYELPDNLRLFAAVNHVGNRQANDKNTAYYGKYTIYDIGLAKRFSPTLDARLTIRNLTDEIYEGIGYLAPGRLVTATLNAKF